MTERARHFSLLREFTAADLLTLGNAAAGMASILSCLEYAADGATATLWWAVGLLPLSFLFDALDGWVARKTGHASRFGADLDSLADIVSFGVAPAVLAWSCGMRTGLDAVVLVYFVCCGISRLARFNVTAAALADAATGKVKYFEGTPIPSSLVLVAVLAAALGQGAIGPQLWGGRLDIADGLALHPLVLAFAVSGSAMISGTLRVPKP